MMRNLLLGALFALLPLAPASGADTPREAVETVLILGVEGELYLDPEGAVTDFRIDGELPGGLAASVRKAVGAWRFEPVVVDGKPQSVVTRMRVSLAAKKIDENYQVRVENVTFPGLIDAKQAARKAEPDKWIDLDAESRKYRPLYPRELQKQGITGRVLLAFRFDDAGTILDVAAEQSMLFDVDTHRSFSTHAIQLFEREALASARTWRLSVPANAPRSVRAVKLAVDFVMEGEGHRNGDGTNSQRWRLVTRTPKRRIDWLPQKAYSPSVSDIAGGSLVPVADAAIKLRSPVLGALL